MKKALPFYFLIVVGLGLLVAAIFAKQFGLDHNADWGLRRLLLLGSGALILVISGLIQWRESVMVTLPPWIRSAFNGLIMNPVFRLLWKHRLATLTSLATLTIAALYLFFVTAGTWTIWPETSRYYDDLATAFREGHLDLNEPPPPAAFVALIDPYEPSARNNIPTIRTFVDSVWDLSFYQGRFYLYWGPAPALLLLVVKLFYPGPIPDQFLVFGFLVGLLIFTILLILKLWRRFYQDVPFLLVLTGILAAGLVSPIPWMLGRAAIYEATIAGGQFFLIVGLYFAYSAIEKPAVSHSRLFIAALFWAFAAGSRTIILIPAAFLTLLICVWTLRNNGKTKQLLKAAPKLLTLGLPLVFGSLSIGWYNWSRFGSVFETGLRYTLTFHNLDKFYGESFSLFYVLPSLWIYLFNPIEIQARFPFVLATYGHFPSFLSLSKPNIYHSDQITGLAFCVPFILFSVVSVVNAVSLISQRLIKRHPTTDEGKGEALLWISICLAGSGFLTFAAILFYFNITMRFLAEFIPSLMLLSILGVWQGYHLLQRKPLGRHIYVFFTLYLAVVTILVSLLLAMSENYNRFQHYNPHLMKQLIQLFSH